MIRWYLVPLILWLVLVVYLTISLSDIVLPYVNEWLKMIPGFDAVPDKQSWWATLRGWIASGISFSVALIIKILLWYLLGRYMKYAVQILLSPLLAYLSELTEEKLTGRTFPFNLPQFVSDVVRGILITLRNLLLETLLVAAGMVLSFFLPVFAPFVAGALFIINCYFMGFNFFDYVTERHRLGIGQSVQYMRRNRLTLIGFGLAYNLVSAIPVLDWLLAPLSAASGAVMADLELDSDKSLSKAAS